MQILHVFYDSISSSRLKFLDLGIIPGFTKIVNKYDINIKIINIKNIVFSTVFNNFHSGISNKHDNPTNKLIPINDTHQCGPIANKY